MALIQESLCTAVSRESFWRRVIQIIHIGIDFLQNSPLKVLMISLRNNSQLAIANFIIGWKRGSICKNTTCIQLSSLFAFRLFRDSFLYFHNNVYYKESHFSDWSFCRQSVVILILHNLFNQSQWRKTYGIRQSTKLFSRTSNHKTSFWMTNLICMRKLV